MRGRNGRSNEEDSRPELAMGGASDSERSPLPDDAVGNALVERRRMHEPGYGGPERRVAGQ